MSRPASPARLGLRSLAAVTRKEFIHILRDPGTLAIALVVPVAMLLLFGYALSLDVRDIPTGVVDLDRTPAARAFAERMTASSWFRAVARPASEAAARDLIDRGRIAAALVIPAGFGRTRAAGRTADVLLLLDGANSVTATLALGYAEALAARETGITFAPRPRVLFNPARRSTEFLVPGLLAIITMFMTILLPSLAVVREKERGTIEILRAGPIRPAAFIVGKLLPYGLICVFDLLTVMLAGALVFGVGVQGSLPLLLLMSVPFLLTGLALGLLISTFVDSLQVAMYVAFLSSVLPSFMLSGFLFPIGSMPGWLQAASWLVPARYFLVVIRGVYLKSAPAPALLESLFAALVFGILAITAAVERLRRSL